MQGPGYLFTTTEYIIANALSPPVCFEPAVIVYHRRFQMDPAVMLRVSITAGSYYEPAVIDYHRRFEINRR